jgi:lysozyme
MSIINRIKQEEGFKSIPYKCPEGVLTWGHGFTNITVEEAEAVLKIRVSKELDWLNKKSTFSFKYSDKPAAVREVLIDMTYQLGRTGLLNFKKMLQAIEEGDYKLASEELMNSKYAKQTTNRAMRNRNLLSRI